MNSLLNIWFVYIRSLWNAFSKSLSKRKKHINLNFDWIIFLIEWIASLISRIIMRIYMSSLPLLSILRKYLFAFSFLLSPSKRVFLLHFLAAKILNYYFFLELKRKYLNGWQKHSQIQLYLLNRIFIEDRLLKDYWRVDIRAKWLQTVLKKNHDFLRLLEWNL